MSYYFKLSKKSGQLPYNCHSYPVYIEADSDILDVFKKGATVLRKTSDFPMKKRKFKEKGTFLQFAPPLHP